MIMVAGLLIRLVLVLFVELGGRCLVADIVLALIVELGAVEMINPLDSVYPSGRSLVAIRKSNAV